ncbi:hypothetical protein H3284_10975 [Escherichia coli]|nr:hypothetical protein [Escherichia coli]MBB9062190.1 hypothetical protein [Escherichia coli]MBB9472496.1 hypothetical protein [Escherichia coli]MBB9514711.1 hypothetical protein [Escherichia coli]MBB9732180.1 hypothetical protein [Escherichia coli]
MVGKVAQSSIKAML